MKVCSKCGLEKGLEEFHKSKRYGTQPWCKDCSLSNRKQYYQDNKKKENARNKEWESTFRDWYIELKDKKNCTDCKRKYPSYVMQFDHKEEFEKVQCVSRMVSDGRSKASILQEIAKCDLVCANCHAERTHSRRKTLP